MEHLPESQTFKYNFIGKVALKGKEIHTQIYSVEVLDKVIRDKTALKGK